MTPKEEAELDRLMSAHHALTKRELKRLKDLIRKSKETP